MCTLSSYKQRLDSIVCQARKDKANSRHKKKTAATNEGTLHISSSLILKPSSSITMANFVLQAQGQRFPWEVRRQIALEALRDRPFDYGLLEEFFSMGKHRMWKRDMEELKYLIANSELQIDEALLDHECRRGRAKWKKLHPKVFKYCENIRVVYR